MFEGETVRNIEEERLERYEEKQKNKDLMQTKGECF